MNSFFFTGSTVNRLDAMANIIPRWIRKDMRHVGMIKSCGHCNAQIGLIFEVFGVGDGAMWVDKAIFT